MNFDINPLGHQMHLQQIDREASTISQYRKIARNTAKKETPQSQGWISKRSGWIARFFAAFSAPRFSD